MSQFELIYQAVSKKCEKTVSLALLDTNPYGVERNELNLSVVGQLAKEGQWKTVTWFFDHWSEEPKPVLIGAILGGHIKSLENPKDLLPKSFSRFFRDRSAYTMMIEGFAQIGANTLVFDYLLKMHNDDYCGSDLLRAAMKGAARGKQTDLIDGLIREYSQKDAWTGNMLMETLLQESAWAGNQKLIQEVLARQPVSSIANSMKLIMRGCGQSGKTTLLPFLKEHYLNQYNSTMLDAFKEAAQHNHIHFIEEVIQKDPLFFKTAQHAIVSMGRFDVLDQFINQDNNLVDIALFFNYDSNTLLEHLTQFATPKLMQQFCKALRESSIAQTEKEALNVFALKSRYYIKTRQALFLHKNPHCLNFILMKQEKDPNLYHYDGDSLYRLEAKKTELNSWQFEDMVKRVRKNEPMSQLIDNLKKYISNSTWVWEPYHHDRCVSFLNELKKDRCQLRWYALIVDQCERFTFPKRPYSPPVTDKTPKHETPVTNSARDGYCSAIYKYKDSLPKQASVGFFCKNNSLHNEIKNNIFQHKSNQDMNYYTAPKNH